MTPDELDAADRTAVEVDDDPQPEQTDNRVRAEDGPQDDLPQDPDSTVDGDATIDGTPDVDG